MFHVGQSVVCITDDWKPPAGMIMVCPKAGRVYTVKRNSLKPWSNVPYGIELFEIPNMERQWVDGCYPPYFDAKFFRPLDTNKVEILQHEVA